MATIKLKARPLGATGVLRRFALASALLPGDTREAQARVGKVAEVVFGAYVPVKYGRALRGIGSSGAGGTVTVTDFAKNPATGYDYIGVTRFGHRVARIYPKHVSGTFNAKTGKRRRGVLRFSTGGGTLFRASVAGYKPASDWATDAQPELYAAADGVAAQLAHTIEERLG